MKRDMHLVRQLLLYYEAKPDDRPEECPKIEVYSDIEVRYHLLLMHEANLLRCEPTKSTTSDRVIKVLPFSLTWEGHDFLDASRDTQLWKRALEIVGSKVGSTSFGVLKVLLADLARKQLGIGAT